MPKVILLSKSGMMPLSHPGFVQTIRQLVAEAASTDDLQLTIEDIDFYHEEISIWSKAPDVSIEIETIGYPQRKKKLGQRSVVKKLKEDILAIPFFPTIDPQAPLLWIKF